MITNEEKKLFPIRELSELTQVNTVTIRAWERRYGLLKPQRTAKGHRLYSEEDVERVKAILAYMAQGVPVRKVKALLNQDPHDSPNPSSDDWRQLMQQLESIITRRSPLKIRDFLNRIFLTYPVNLCRQEILEPVIRNTHQHSPGDKALLQSAIIDYSIMRLNAKTAKKKQQPVILICAEHSPIWKLALSAIELTDANFYVSFINQPCHLTTWLSLVEQPFNEPSLVKKSGIEQSPQPLCIVFQEGVWKGNEKHKILTALQQHNHLLLCGTAAIVAGIEQDRTIPSPEKILNHLTTAIHSSGG